MCRELWDVAGHSACGWPARICLVLFGAEHARLAPSPVLLCLSPRCLGIQHWVGTLLPLSLLFTSFWFCPMQPFPSLYPLRLFIPTFVCSCLSTSSSHEVFVCSCNGCFFSSLSSGLGAQMPCSCSTPTPLGPASSLSSTALH